MLKSRAFYLPKELLSPTFPRGCGANQRVTGGWEPFFRKEDRGQKDKRAEEVTQDQGTEGPALFQIGKLGSEAVPAHRSGRQ